MKINTNLPDAKFGVVDNVVGHGKLSLVFRRMNRLDLPDYTALVHQYAAVLLRDVRQNCNHQRVGSFNLPQPFGQANPTLHIVTVPCQKCNVGTARYTSSLNKTTRDWCTTNGIRSHFFLSFFCQESNQMKNVRDDSKVKKKKEEEEEEDLLCKTTNCYENSDAFV